MNVPDHPVLFPFFPVMSPFPYVFLTLVGLRVIITITLSWQRLLLTIFSQVFWGVDNLQFSLFQTFRTFTLRPAKYSVNLELLKSSKVVFYLMSTVSYEANIMYLKENAWKSLFQDPIINCIIAYETFDDVIWLLFRD